jgi:hypothetical protein
MQVGAWVAGLVLLWAPGFLLTEGLRLFRGEDRVVRFAIDVALGLTIWPLVFLWTSALHLPWTPAAMRAIGGAVIVAALILLAVRAPRARWSRLRPAVRGVALVALLAAGAAALRIHDIRGLAFPPWVDGVHHVMIIRLLLDGGVVPATADPYIPGGAFFYHWGFHLPAAMAAAMTGNTAPPDVPPFLLQYGQLLNALTFVTMYAAGRVLLRSREAGIFTAVLVSFVSYFPAFYVSWGRYTHLAGTLVLPPLLIVLWRLATRRRRGALLAVAAILAAGLALIHVRVSFFALAFAVVLAGVGAGFSRPHARPAEAGRYTPLLRWAVAALIAGILISPWVVRLANEPRVAELAQGPAGTPLYLIGANHNRELLSLATCGFTGMAGWFSMPLTGRIASAAWCLLVIAVSIRARRAVPWRPLLLIAAWCGLIFVGLKATRFASLDSAVITLFMPLSIAGAALITYVVRRVPAVATVLAIAIAAGGASMLTEIVNPITVFADAADLRALRWIARNAPPTALFAVEARPWISPAWVGVDGGYWIGVATGRRSILPPLLYGWSLPPDEIMRIDTLLAAWSARRWDALRAAGVTHVYSGSMRRASLLGDPHLRPIYRDGGAVVYELVP